MVTFVMALCGGSQVCAQCVLKWCTRSFSVVVYVVLVDSDVEEWGKNTNIVLCIHNKLNQLDDLDLTLALHYKNIDGSIVWTLN